ncbi:MAG: heavy-metal-associated domain-containing protein [Mariprofundaceae bacterium]|nr:heavy-metal-associated domain-containing protein [Mariprofundaceae bacterium]
MKEITIKVADMKCEGCGATIRKALLKLNGVYDARADYKTGNVWLHVTESRFRIAEADAAIRGLGYELEES